MEKWGSVNEPDDSEGVKVGLLREGGRVDRHVPFQL
jgi:hypothetical protein